MKIYTLFFILFFSFTTSYTFGQTVSKKDIPDSVQIATNIDCNNVNGVSTACFKMDEENAVAYFNQKQYKLSELGKINKTEFESIMIFDDEASAKEALKEENTLVIIKNKPEKETDVN